MDTDVTETSAQPPMSDKPDDEVRPPVNGNDDYLETLASSLTDEECAKLLKLLEARHTGAGKATGTIDMEDYS